jgi:hypothetical protein
MARPGPKAKPRGSSTTRPVRGAPRKRTGTYQSPSSVALAPVSIGNTIRGVKSNVVQRRDGCIINGRDFMFTPIGTASIETWTLAGGAPLTPAAFVDSTIRQYMQMYNKFKFHSFTAHYLTSSPTSSDGDIMFYHNKNRDSVFLNQTSNNLLPFVISDPNTVLGPQWQNHSARFEVTSDWKSTDYGMNSDVTEYSAGDLFLLTKSTTSDSPGYVMFDYVIEFKERSIMPRLLTLPMAKILWSNVALNVSGTATVNFNFLTVVGGNNLSGGPSTLPTGAVFGDIFKVIFDRTNSVLNGGSSTYTTLNVLTNGSIAANNVAMNDGTTLYAMYGNNWWTLYTTIDAAILGTQPLAFSASGALVSSTLQFWMSFVTSTTGSNVQPNF